jgi:hypothetical protein
MGMTKGGTEHRISGKNSWNIFLEFFEDGVVEATSWGIRSYAGNLDKGVPMRMIRVLFVSLGIGAATIPASAQWTLDLETGLAWSGYNNVRIPGDAGTKFSLSHDLKAESTIFGRMVLGRKLGRRHTVSLLIAPLSLDAKGSVPRTLLFHQETFAAGIPLRAVYKFNSFRLTYRYTLVDSPRWEAGIGLTVKIRDAAIEVRGGGKSSRRTDLGFVPLINFKVEHKLDGRWSVLLEGDALAAPQGRAEDVLLALRLALSGALKIKAGYRILEGGADNDKVYTFALINYLVVGATLSF